MPRNLKKCDVCDEEICLSWTDTHGVGQCIRCGTPYRALHYDDDGKRVEKPLELLLIAEGVERRRRCWREHQRPMPGGFSMGAAEDSQEVARLADFKAYEEWREAEKAMGSSS